jgi:hypothetical protein
MAYGLFLLTKLAQFSHQFQRGARIALEEIPPFIEGVFPEGKQASSAKVTPKPAPTLAGA